MITALVEALLALLLGLLTPVDCAQHVDFPDSVPPRYSVCVPAEEAG